MPTYNLVLPKDGGTGGGPTETLVILEADSPSKPITDIDPAGTSPSAVEQFQLAEQMGQEYTDATGEVMTPLHMVRAMSQYAYLIPTEETP